MTTWTELLHKVDWSSPDTYLVGAAAIAGAGTVAYVGGVVTVNFFQGVGDTIRKPTLMPKIVRTVGGFICIYGSVASAEVPARAMMSEPEHHTAFVLRNALLQVDPTINVSLDDMVVEVRRVKFS